MEQQSLSAHFQLITVDLRGHGSSTGGSNCGFSAFASDLHELLEVLDLRDVILVGWSMGAQIAVHSFPQLKSRVAGLVLIAGTPRFCAADDYPHGLPLREVRSLGLRLRKNYQSAAEGFAQEMLAAQERNCSCSKVLLTKVMENLPAPEVARLALDALVAIDLRPLVQKVRVPVLLIHGEEDSICLPGASRYLYEHLAKGQLQLLPGAGHAPFITRAAEVNTFIREFVVELHGTDR